MARRKLPPHDVVAALVRDHGWSTYRIADEYGATRAAVTHCLRQLGIESPRAPASYKEYIPWRVKVAHNEGVIIRKLRLWARAQMRLEVTPAQRQQLDQWEALMRDYVVDYDAECGFAYVPRQPGEMGMVRRP